MLIRRSLSKSFNKNAMKRKTFSIFLILSFVFSVSAQNKEARQIDEFGNIPCGDLRHRLDSFLVELQNNPQSRGYVIVYDGKHYSCNYSRGRNPEIKYQLPVFGEATLLTQQMLKHFKFRNVSPDSYLFISGGYRENYTVELLVVPTGAKPPKPTLTADEIKYRKGKLMEIICGEV